MMLYILANYGYLLPVGNTSAEAFAGYIKDHYSLENPRNKEVHEYVCVLTGTFQRDHSGGVRYVSV